MIGTIRSFTVALLPDYLGHFSPSNLTAYVVNAHTLSVTWDLPSAMNEIDRLFLSITELGPVNRTIQTQSLDKTIKKLDIRINPHDSLSVHPNTTVHFSALSMNRDGQNSSSVQYQLYVNTLSKFSCKRHSIDQGTSCSARAFR